MTVKLILLEFEAWQLYLFSSFVPAKDKGEVEEENVKFYLQPIMQISNKLQSVQAACFYHKGCQGLKQRM